MAKHTYYAEGLCERLQEIQVALWKYALCNWVAVTSIHLRPHVQFNGSTFLPHDIRDFGRSIYPRPLLI